MKSKLTALSAIVFGVVALSACAPVYWQQTGAQPLYLDAPTSQMALDQAIQDCEQQSYYVANIDDCMLRHGWEHQSALPGTPQMVEMRPPQHKLYVAP